MPNSTVVLYCIVMSRIVACHTTRQGQNDSM